MPWSAFSEFRGISLECKTHEGLKVFTSVATSKKVEVPRQCKPLELKQQTKMIPDRAGNAQESHRNLEPLRQNSTRGVSNL